MNKLTILSFLLLAIIVSACGEDTDLPNAINVPKDGGTFVVSDKGPSFYGLSISNYDGDQVGARPDPDLDPDDGTIADVESATFDWLTATAIYSEGKIIIKAEPNTTGKHRTLYVDVMIADSGHSIKIRQRD